jgi:hypothetical protein
MSGRPSTAEQVLSGEDTSARLRVGGRSGLGLRGLCADSRSRQPRLPLETGKTQRPSGRSPRSSPSSASRSTSCSPAVDDHPSAGGAGDAGRHHPASGGIRPGPARRRRDVIDLDSIDSPPGTTGTSSSCTRSTRAAAPRARTALMRHNGRELGIVLTGQLGSRSASRTRCSAGKDSIAFDSAIPHRLHNDGDGSPPRSDLSAATTIRPVGASRACRTDRSRPGGRVEATLIQSDAARRPGRRRP